MQPVEEQSFVGSDLMSSCRKVEVTALFLPWLQLQAVLLITGREENVALKITGWGIL